MKVHILISNCTYFWHHPYENFSAWATAMSTAGLGEEEPNGKAVANANMQQLGLGACLRKSFRQYLLKPFFMGFAVALGMSLV